MGLPNKDEMKGKYEQAKGSVKRTAGNLLDDDQMRAEGQMEKEKGETRESYGTIKRKVGETVESIGDAIKK